MLHLNLLVFGTLLNLCCMNQIICAENGTTYKHMQLDTDGRLQFAWRFDAVDLHFELSCADPWSWVGVGLSPHGGMGGADILVVQRNPNGTVKAYDMHGPAKGNGRPTLDKKQDYEVVSFSFRPGRYSVSLKRRLNTCDKEDRTIAHDTDRLIWAFHPLAEGADAEAHDNFPAQFPMHGQHFRGVRSVMLLDNVENDVIVTMPPDAFTMEFTVTNVELPADYHTLYWCQAFKLEQRKKHHLIKIEPIFSPPKNKAYVHHVNLYHCWDDMSRFVGHPEPCFSRDGLYFSEMQDCNSRILAGWAVGGNDENHILEPFGQPFFEQGYAPYVVIEVHYDNAHYNKDVVDSSGLRLTFTPTLRPIEVGSVVLAMGTSPKEIIIPPRAKEFVHYVFCDSFCLHEIPPEGIEILSAFPHAHLAGRRMRLRHIRDNVELAPIVDDGHYDFNYQQWRNIQPPRRVFRKDKLLAECFYDTEINDRATFGGFETRSEMCIFYLTYAPKLPSMAIICSSGPFSSTIETAFQMPRDSLERAFANASDYVAAANTYDWSGPPHADWAIKSNLTRIEEFQAFVTYGRHFRACGRMRRATRSELRAHPEKLEIVDYNDYNTVLNIPHAKLQYIAPDICPGGLQDEWKSESKRILSKQIQEQIGKSVSRTPVLGVGSGSDQLEGPRLVPLVIFIAGANFF